MGTHIASVLNRMLSMQQLYAWMLFLYWTIMYVDAFMSAGMKGSGCSVIFCRYTNHDSLDPVTILV
jgi:hypothetical protein